MISRRVFTALVLFVSIAFAAHADVKVSGMFTDNVVLQRDIPVPVWGWAEPGEKVTVKIGEAQASGEADAQGKWSLRLPPLKMSTTPQELVISGKNTITLKNVLVGDVWVCSGQSNMEWNLGSCSAPEDIASADFPMIRRIKFDHRALPQPDTHVTGRWDVCSPKSVAGFTAVGFYFARRIQKEVGVPIGLIDDNWGGTRIEPWIPPAGFEMEPALSKTLVDVENQRKNYREQISKNLGAMEKWIADTKAALAANADVPAMPQLPKNALTDAGFPTTLYNGMMHPVIPFGIKGALWYQGESNGGEGEEYYLKKRALIGGWRKLWNQGDFPFYFVQLANFQQPSDNPAGGDGWAKVRMAQTKSLLIPNTGMAVIIDIGEANDIHPKNKFDVGERLARWALRNDYGKKDTVVSGPLFKAIKVEDGKIRVSFDHAAGGLIVGKKDGRKPTEEVAGGKLARFAVAGEDKKWVWADAVIDGETVVVSSPQVPKPVAVRYAYSMNPTGCNLYNKEGLPASPFRSDDW
jgi:sialate O-acetylesterase